MDQPDLAAVADLIRRPAVREFDPARAVRPDLLEQIVDVARWTGSARNRQPWRFVAVHDPALLRELATTGAYAQFVGQAPAALVLASEDDGFRDTPFDAGRITQSVVVAAAAVGLGCCPATIFPEDNVDRAARMFGLDPGWRPHHVLALGYPREPAARRGAGRSAVPRGRRGLRELLSTASGGNGNGGAQVDGQGVER